MPLPGVQDEAKKRKKNEHEFPLYQMKPGDSIITHKYSYPLSIKIGRSVNYWRKKFQPKWIFAIRKTNKKIGIWRIK